MRGVVFVMTSNYPPDGLWPNGLTRDRFLPAIALLNERLDVLEVDAGVDYRLRALAQVRAYHTPLGAAADAALAAAFEKMRSGPDEPTKLVIEGRTLPARKARRQRRLVRFRRLCDGPRSQRDYLELARSYAVLLLSDVPELDRGDGRSRAALHVARRHPVRSSREARCSRPRFRPNASTAKDRTAGSSRAR